jgi:CMP-N-acetylneuraminic acid synthetase
MIHGRSVLAIIPARAGSKGLPGKNVRPLCGKPLIAWTVEKARRSTLLDAVVVSTDGADIADIARAYGAEVPGLRPPALATDVASTYDVIRHVLDTLRRDDGREFDYVVLLEPTSPLREDDDIDRMLTALDDASDRFDSIVSVGQVSEHPSIMKRLVEGRVEPYYGGETAAARRQDNPPAYFPFGVAYIAKTAALLEENTFYTRRCAGYPIQRYQNYEIDDLFDFLCVESVMRHQWGMS